MAFCFYKHGSAYSQFHSALKKNCIKKKWKNFWIWLWFVLLKNSWIFRVYCYILVNIGCQGVTGTSYIRVVRTIYNDWEVDFVDAWLRPPRTGVSASAPFARRPLPQPNWCGGPSRLNIVPGPTSLFIDDRPHDVVGVGSADCFRSSRCKCGHSWQVAAGDFIYNSKEFIKFYTVFWRSKIVHKPTCQSWTALITCL